MDKNACGPSSSPDLSNGWPPLSHVPPPTQFAQNSEEFSKVTQTNGEADEDLDALLFGGKLSSLTFDDDGDDLDDLLFGRTSFLSLATSKDEEASSASHNDESSALFQSGQEAVAISSQQNGSNTHIFTVTFASPSSSNVDEGKSSKPSSEPNHINADGDDDDLTSSSLQNHYTLRTDDEIAITSSNSQSDFGGVSEEEARISSAPPYSITDQTVEHTLSDISGPCSSYLIDKESFASGTVGISSEQLSLTNVADHTATTSSAVTQAGRNARIPVVPEGSLVSSSSLSDSEDDAIEDRRMTLLLSRSGSLKDQDGLPFPPPPPPLLLEESEIVPMTVDTCEDYWTRLHDIRINGCILEYTGIGKSMHDNGFAQSNVPLTPLNHYFELTILDPGEFCYISIGLARKDYNVHKNVGWNRGSIAYHADDGKIFIGGGVGTPFGPRCSSQDVLGCGIIFPNKYAELGGNWPWEMKEEAVKVEVNVDDADDKGAKCRLPTTPRRKKLRAYSLDNFGDISSESEDDIWWDNKNQVCEDKVKVFFMRNRKLLGIKEVRIPKGGGFFPTIGMMSKNERVYVDLHPLTG